MSKTERRRHPRADALLPMKLSLGDDSGEDMVETRIRNLSCSGIRFHAPHSLQLMSRVQIALELPDADQLLISGVVVRCDIAAARYPACRVVPVDRLSGARKSRRSILPPFWPAQAAA